MAVLEINELCCVDHDLLINYRDDYILFLDSGLFVHSHSSVTLDLLFMYVIVFLDKENFNFYSCRTDSDLTYVSISLSY